MPLVDSTAAAYWTGRPVGTIHRWASEGRIRRDRGRYELDDLPQAHRDEWTGRLVEAAPAPPLPHGAHAA